MEFLVDIIIAVLICSALFYLAFCVRGRFVMPLRAKNGIKLSISITAEGDAPDLEQVINAVVWSMPDAEIMLTDKGMSSVTRRVAETLCKDKAIHIIEAYSTISEL